MKRTVTTLLISMLCIGGVAGCGAKGSLSNADKLKCQNVVSADTYTVDGDVASALSALVNADDPKLVKIGQDFDKANPTDEKTLRDWAQKAERYCLG